MGRTVGFLRWDCIAAKVRDGRRPPISLDGVLERTQVNHDHHQNHQNRGDGQRE